MKKFDCDLFVIGAGSGGVRAARMSANYGARVIISEKYRVGGTCVVRGCIPKKLLSYASKFSESYKISEDFGWTMNNRKFDWNKLISNKDKEISRLSGIYSNNLIKSGVKIIESETSILDRNKIKIHSTGEIISAKNILIATGSQPYIPDIEGSKYGITSNEVFDLKVLPKSCVIVGGGYIAMEFASIFHGLDVDVNIVHRRSSVLKDFDSDIGDSLKEEFEKKSLKLFLNADLKYIKKNKDGYGVGLDNGTIIQTDIVIFCTGRVPNTKSLTLDRLGIKCTSNGAVIVDSHMSTSIPNIFAIGDVTDIFQLTPVAIKEGAVLASNLFNKTSLKVDYSNIPTAVFSQPEIGSVGLTEKEALNIYKRIYVYKTKFKPMYYSLSSVENKTMMKLIVDQETDKILGCHIVGDDAAEIIQIMAILLKKEVTKDEMDKTMALHPTMSEELVTMKDRISVEL
jgi:glutathione reductase (NADPH)